MRQQQILLEQLICAVQDNGCSDAQVVAVLQHISLPGAPCWWCPQTHGGGPVAQCLQKGEVHDS